MKTFKQWMEVVKPVKPLEEIKNYHVRWLVRRDFPKLFNLIKTHPDFIENDEKFEKILVSTLNNQNAIGVVATENDEELEDKEKIVGFLVYFYETGHISSPLIAAKDYDVAHNLISYVKRKFETSKENKLALYFRVPFKDQDVLNAIKDHGFDTKMAQEEEMIHAKYPKTNVKHEEPFKTYFSSIYDRKEKEEEEVPKDDDPFGLFKDKPWKK